MAVSVDENSHAVVTITASDPDAGTVLVNGKDVTGWKTQDAITAGVGMVHQHFMLVPTLTVAENVILGMEPRKGMQVDLHRAVIEVESLCKKCGLHVDAKAKVADLSVGEAQRVEILKALYRGAKILILDEPTAGVDIALRRSMWQFISNLNKKGLTVILTTHYLEEAEALCNRIAIIDQGRIIADSPTQELLQKLHSETIILYGELPETIPALQGYSLRKIDAQTLEVDLLNQQSIDAVMTHLSHHNIPIHRMKNKANRLEEMFVRLVEESHVQ